jgi:hypothetical protein
MWFINYVSRTHCPSAPTILFSTWPYSGRPWWFRTKETHRYHMSALPSESGTSALPCANLSCLRKNTIKTKIKITMHTWLRLLVWCRATAEAWKSVDTSVESEVPRVVLPNMLRELRTASREFAYTFITNKSLFIDKDGEWTNIFQW